PGTIGQATGLRCVLRQGGPPYTAAWFGDGVWDGTPYPRLGIFHIASTLGGEGAASDLCGPPFGQPCKNLPSLAFQPRSEPSPGADFKAFRGFKVKALQF